MTKQQHYVPQFYLRQFASTDEQIWVYDKIDDKIFRTSVRNVAGERYFYDSKAVEAVLGDKQAVEKYLSTLEGNFSDKIARLLHRLRTNGFIRLHPETRAVLALFTAFQLIRTKEHRISSFQMQQQLKKFLKKHPRTEKLIAEVDESMSEESLRESHARQLLDLPHILKMAKILSSHIWIIGRRHPSQSFYTSDEPITKQENVKIPFRGNDGIACVGIEVQVPLAPDYVLTLYERTYFANLVGMDGRVLNFVSEQNMIYQRQFSVKYSSRFVFCQENDFAFAKQLCDEEPHWRDPDRKRVTSNHDDDPAPSGFTNPTKAAT